MQKVMSGKIENRRGLRGVRAVLLLGVAFTLFAPGAVWAQVQTLPKDIVTATSALSLAQIDAIKQFVAANVGDLAADTDPLKIRRARNTIMDPLQDTQVSAPFRLEYTRALQGKLSELVGSGKSIVVVNALLVAGELATEPGVAIVEKQLGNKDISIRYTAVKGLGSALDAMGRRTPALSPDRALRIVDTLGKMMPGEEDERIYDGIARGLVAGMGVTEVRDRATTELCARLVALLKQQAGKDIDEAKNDTLIVATSAVRDAAAAFGGRPKLSATARAEAAKLGVEMLTAASGWIKAGKEFPTVGRDDAQDVSEQKRESRLQVRQIVALGEAIVTLAGDAKGQVGGLAKLLESARPEDDARYLESASQLLSSLPK